MKSNPEDLYNRLNDIFNAAADAYPQHAYTFKEELDIYKGALLENNPLKQQILRQMERLMDMPGGEESARPPEVVAVLRVASRLFKAAP